jgi:hypothetical protein
VAINIKHFYHGKKNLKSWDLNYESGNVVKAAGDLNRFPVELSVETHSAVKTNSL